MRAAVVQVGRHNRAGVGGGILIGAVLAATAAQAQNTTMVIPAPGIERYSLPPGANQIAPAPTPTPTPVTPTLSLTPAPPPSVIPTLQIPRTTRTPSAPAPRAPSLPQPSPAAPTPVATPSASATPAPVPTADVGPTVVPRTPVATEPAPPPPWAEAPGGAPTWLWWLVGVVLVALGGVFAWRRFGGGEPETAADGFGPAPAAEPSAPMPSPRTRPIVGGTSAMAQPDRALVLDFRPQRLWTRGPDAFLAFELTVTNTGGVPVEAVRPVIALASAGPDTAAEIATFQANAPHLPGGEPFALRAGEARTISGELTLPGDAMYVTSAADRALIVPLALVSLQWRGGLSLARANEAFVIGTGDAATPRLGPIWVDRAGLAYARLDARRFTPGPA